MNRVGIGVLALTLACVFFGRRLTAGPARTDAGSLAIHGRADPAVQLALARRLERAGQCGAAIFHYRRFLSLSPSHRDQRKVRAAVKRCMERLGLRPLKVRPRPAPRPLTNLGYPREFSFTRPVRVSAGVFLAGASKLSRAWVTRLCGGSGPLCARLNQEQPLRKVRLGAFEMDRTEVTRAQWARCVAAGRCKAVPVVSRDPETPVVKVTWYEARDYCRFKGGRLPTETEWEKAARGVDVPVRNWPWGRVAISGCANLKQSGSNRRLSPVGRHPCDVSYYGALDMAGNAMEWVMDRFGAKGGGGASSSRPAGGAKSELRVAKGGSYRTTLFEARVAARIGVLPASRRDDLGFRCVRPIRPRVLKRPGIAPPRRNEAPRGKKTKGRS